MPSGIARVELIFESNGYGWTENYFIQDSTPDLSVANARSLILIQKRAEINGIKSFITFRSISDTNGQRAGGTYPVAASLGQGSYAATDVPSVAFLFKRQETTGKNKSNVFLRGIADQMVAQGGLYQPTPGYTIDVDAYRTELVTGQWGWLGNDNPTSHKSPIVSVADDADKKAIFTLRDPILPIGPPLPKIEFRVSGLEGARNLNNSWVGQVLTTTTIRTVSPVPFFPATPNTGRLSFRVLRFYQITGSSIMRVVTRHAGRVLFHSPGRQKAQARG